MKESPVHPREVADKTKKENLSRALDLALSLESDAVRLNTQTFNTNRYRAIAQIDDYEALKDRARAVKEESIRQLPHLVELLTNAIRRRGGNVFFAETKQEAVRYVQEVCRSQGARLVVKAKSITSEEIGLNQALEADHIEVAETDLAEFILQVSKEQPSHSVAPAIHRSRERISKLFKEHFKTEKALDTGEQLTEFARDILREKFLSADVGISGANMISAAEGAILLVESEGNIRLTTHLPAVHIAIAGIEKIVPTRKDFGTFIELLAASATGQPLSTYTNILEPPLPLPVLNLNGRSDTQREFHLVLLDNGRMKLREDDDLRETLYCIRCGACMNVCANFQAVGGHAFGGECYTGGIGGAWTVATTGSLQAGRFADLCTGCSRCVPNCPVRINIPGLNTVIKQRLLDAGEGSLQKEFFGRFSTLAKLASVIPGFVNRMNTLAISKAALSRIFGIEKRRSLPSFARKTLRRQYRAYRKTTQAGVETPAAGRKLILFADVFTQYNNPDVGMAVVRVFEKLGLPVELGKVLDDGRAALSQGLVPSARKSAHRVATYLGSLILSGYDILFAEPSVLAMVRQEYRTLIHGGAFDARVPEHCYDPIEYLNLMIAEGKLGEEALRGRIRKTATKVFYHGHCQMKSIGIGSSTPEFLEKLGFTVAVSTAECCGMAGSFGYKSQYYELSKNVGKDLAREIISSVGTSGGTAILASGTSCREQIGGEVGGHIIHPIQFLDEILS